MDEEERYVPEVTDVIKISYNTTNIVGIVLNIEITNGSLAVKVARNMINDQYPVDVTEYNSGNAKFYFIGKYDVDFRESDVFKEYMKRLETSTARD